MGEQTIKNYQIIDCFPPGVGLRFLLFRVTTAHLHVYTVFFTQL